MGQHTVEKIGGTVHFALGAGYPETGNTNESGLHWDMVVDLRPGAPPLVELEHPRADLSVEERGAGVTTMVRTVLDCAKSLPFDQALSIADSALRNGDVTTRELLWHAERLPTTGRSPCLRVAREADGRADVDDAHFPGWALEPELLIRADALLSDAEVLASHAEAKRALAVE